MYKTSNTHQFDECDSALFARFTAFIERTVYTAKLDYLKQTRHTHHEILMGNIPDEAVYEPDFEKLIITQEGGFAFEEERIARAFQDLPLLKQEILKMTYRQQMSAPEIASHLNCSVRFVYNQRSRALQILRNSLLEVGDDCE